MTFCLLTEFVLNATVILYLEKLTFETAPADTFAFLMITTGFIVVVNDVELLVTAVVDVEDVECVEVDVDEEVDDVVDVEVEDDEGIIVFSIMPPLLPPLLLETVVVTVVVVVDVVVVTGADMVIEDRLTLFAVTGVEAESVINTFADTVLPASVDGTNHRKVLDVPVIPV